MKIEEHRKRSFCQLYNKVRALAAGFLYSNASFFSVVPRVRTRDNTTN